MALNDQAVQKQIEQMISFIDQEADEKVDEINAKADEEFEIEKGRLVQQQRKKIISFYERKAKQLEQQKRVQESQLINQTRLRVLKFQEDQIDTILSEAREQLIRVQEDKDKYKQLLLSLITQGLYQLLEKSVSVKCRKEDVSIVELLVVDAANSYKKASGNEVQIVIDHTQYLTDETCGGVVMSNKDGSIRVCNTLDARLDMIGQQMMPEIRELLFGKNPNRKFTD